MMDTPMDTSPMSYRTMDIVNGVLAAGGSVLTLYLLWRVIAGPDAVRTLHMRAARWAENFCQREATTWARLADVAKRSYDRSRVTA